MTARQIVVIGAMFFLASPAGLLADQAASDPTSTAAGGSASQLQNSGQTTDNAAGLSVLQPAGVGSSSSSLQPESSANSSLTPSTDQNLQQSGSSDQAKLLIGGDADQPQALSQPSGPGWLGSLLVVLLAATALTGLIWLVGRRRWPMVELPL